MRKLGILIITISIVIVNMAYAQDSTKRRHTQLSIYYEKNQGEKKYSNSIGFSYELFISKNVSLNYSASIGDGDHGVFSRTYAGIAGSLYLIGQSTVNDGTDDNDDEGNESPDILKLSSIALALIPEGINIYIPLHLPNNHDAYIVSSILPFRYEKYENNSGFASAFNMKIQYFLNDKAFIMPYVGISIYHEMTRATFNIGIALGASF